MSEHYCKNCKNSNGNNTCSLTGALHTTGIECPSFRQKESKMSNETNRIGQEPDHPYIPPTEAGHAARTFISHSDGALKAKESKMFKIDDKVRVIADEEQLRLRGISNLKLVGAEGEITKRLTRMHLPIHVTFEDKHTSSWWFEAQDLELIETEETNEAEADEDYDPADGPPIRTFDSGATRDTDQGKLDYLKALSPIVLRRYVQYLDKHRKQSDGSYRDFDNWKKGIPPEAYISGGGRHFMDTWLLTDGYATEDNHGPVELQDSLCAQLFNLMGRLHEILKKELDNGHN